jgi:hypothetical protein
VDGKTVAVLTFSGNGIIGGSLADGSYTLTIRAIRIHDSAGQRLDGDGDHDVDLRDLSCFLGALGRREGQHGLLDYFDFDGDHDVDLRDALAFLGGWAPDCPRNAWRATNVLRPPMPSTTGTERGKRWDPGGGNWASGPALE